MTRSGSCPAERARRRGWDDLPRDHAYSSSPPAPSSAAVPLPAEHPLTRAPRRRSSSSAYRGHRGERAPVWFMRQAGRSLPEYRELRVGTRMLDACLDPEMASEITLQPVRRHHVDAGIFFSDIVIPLKLAGVGVDIVAGRGPVLEKPVRTAADVAALPALDPAALEPIARPSRARSPSSATPRSSASRARRSRSPRTSSRAARARTTSRPARLMHADPDAWDALMRWAPRSRASSCARRSWRRQRRAALRLVGRRPLARRLHAARRPGVRARARPRAHDPPRPTSTCRSSTSASARASCSARCATWASTRWASTGASRSTRRRAGSADPCPSRATSTRRSSRPRGRSSRRTSATCSSAGRRPGARAQPRPRRAARDRPDRAHAHRGPRP